MDYKVFPTDKYNYDILFIVIDCLSKQLYSIPYYKIIDTYSITELFLKYI